MITLFENFKNIESSIRRKFKYAIKKLGGFNIEVRTTYAGDALVDHFHIEFVNKKSLIFLQDVESVKEFFITPAIVGEDRNYWMIWFDVYYNDYESLLRILQSDNPKEQVKIEKSINKYNL